MNPFAPAAPIAHSASPVIVALDFPAEKDLLEFVARLEPGLCRLKIGKEIFTASGRHLVDKLTARGFDVFLDLKYHDIPNTVASACRVAADLGVWMVDMHASGGRRMMEAAREAVASLSQPPLLIGVTVLTSMSDAELAEIGLNDGAAAQVERLARLACDSGLDGVVCSALEAAQLKAALGESFKLVTPGIRLADAVADDQRRVMTPSAALRAGSDYLVIGRPITRAADPLATLAAIHAELGLA